MKKRLLYYQLIKYIHHKNALLITGMRQVGKTTIMQQIYDSIDKPKLWFDFDNPIDHKIFEDIEYKNIYARLQQLSGTTNERLYVFIDEIQNFPEITKIVKYLIDHFSVKFILTGSSYFYLKNLFPESLSGRKFLFQLSPLGFQEYLYFNEKIKIEEIPDQNIGKSLKTRTIFDFKKFEQDYENYLQYGGFPEVVTTPDHETKRLILKNIFASFFEKGIRIISDIKEIRVLRDLILLLVPRVGSTLDITRLSNELGTNRAKIYNYLEFLQAAFFIRLLPKFSRSIDKSVAGGKKIYFTDIGLLNTLGMVNIAQLFENAVINQMSNYGVLSFYNKRNTAEIDVIYEKEISFEIKLNVRAKDIKKLKLLSEKIGIPEYYLISRNFSDMEKVIYPMFL